MAWQERKQSASWVWQVVSTVRTWSDIAAHRLYTSGRRSEQMWTTREHAEHCKGKVSATHVACICKRPHSARRSSTNFLFEKWDIGEIIWKMVELQLFPIFGACKKTSQKRNSQTKHSQATKGRASRVFNRCIQRRASERRASLDTRSLQVEPRSANWICLETDPSKTYHGPPPPSTHRLDSRADKLKARIHTRPGEDRQALLNISNGLSLGWTAVPHLSIKISHPSTLADTTVSKLRHRQGCQNRLRHIGRCGSRDSMQGTKLPEKKTKTKVLQPWGRCKVLQPS